MPAASSGQRRPAGSGARARARSRCPPRRAPARRRAAMAGVDDDGLDLRQHRAHRSRRRSSATPTWRGLGEGVADDPLGVRRRTSRGARRRAAARAINAPSAASSSRGQPPDRGPGARLASSGRARPRTAARAPAYCSGSGADGASSIGSVPDCVLGKAMTSRMFVWWRKRRPAVDPERDAAVRRRAVLERLEHRAEPLLHLVQRVALQAEAALEQGAVARSGPTRRRAPSRSARCRTASRGHGRRGRRANDRRGRPSAVVSSGSSSGTTPLNGLCVASQRSARRPTCTSGSGGPSSTRARSGRRAQPAAELDPQPAEHVVGRSPPRPRRPG